MRVACLFLVVLCVAVAQQPPSQEWGSLVSRLHQASVEKNFDALSSLLAESAVLRVNGREHRGREAVVMYYTGFLSPLMVHSHQITSPFYPSLNTVHFTLQSFYAEEEPTMGECVAIVHSLERIVVNSEGKIVFMRSESEETAAQIDDDLKCEHNERHHAHSRLQDVIIEKSFERHRHIESLDFKRFLRSFSAGAKLVLSVNPADGSAARTAEGHDGIHLAYGVLFNRSSSVAFAPSTPIYLRELQTFSVSSFFAVTHSGCAVSFQTVLYNLFDKKGYITLSEQFLVGTTEEELTQAMLRDCGRRRADPAHTLVEAGEEDGQLLEDDEQEPELHDGLRDAL